MVLLRCRFGSTSTFSMDQATNPTCACGIGEQQRPTQAAGTRQQLVDKGCSSCSKGHVLTIKSPSHNSFALDRKGKNLLDCCSAAETCGLQCPVLYGVGWGSPSGLKFLTSALSTAESFKEKPVHTATTKGKPSGFSKM